MSYQHLNYTQIQNRQLRKIVNHADMLLYDVYGMFPRGSDTNREGGKCVFSVVLVLLCIIDGIARDIYPSMSIDDHEKRFKKLIRKKLPWSTRNNKWIDIGNAAKDFYCEFRNPLVHELDQEKLKKERRPDFLDPKIIHWGEIDKDARDIVKIEMMEEWNDNWPVLYERREEKNKRIILCTAAFYWCVKRMIQDLLADTSIMAAAEKYQNDLLEAARS